MLCGVKPMPGTYEARRRLTRWLRRLGLVAAMSVPVVVAGCASHASAEDAEGKDAQVSLHVDGMHCASCPVAVRMALRDLDGVHDVKVSREMKRADVSYDPTKVTPAKMIEAIERLGYKARVERAKAQHG